MMTCLDFEQQISAMLDGELPEAERDALEAHLRTCESCAAVYRMFSDVSAAVRSLEAEPPADLTDRILAAAEEAKVIDFAEESRRRNRWKRFAAMAACFALIVGVAVFAGQDRMRQSVPAGLMFTKPPVYPHRAQAPVPVEGTENAESENSQGDAAPAGLTSGLTAPLTEAESEPVLALLEDPVEAEAPAEDEKPACVAVSKSEQGEDVETTLWIDGEDVVYTEDGEQFFRVENAADALTELLNAE